MEVSLGMLRRQLVSEHHTAYGTFWSALSGPIGSPSLVGFRVRFVRLRLCFRSNSRPLLSCEAGLPNFRAIAVSYFSSARTCASDLRGYPMGFGGLAQSLGDLLEGTILELLQRF